MFSVVDFDSFKELQQKWYPNILNHGPPNPIIVVVGTKTDLCASQTRVDRAMIEKWVEEIGSVYVEVCAKTGSNLEAPLEEALKIYFKKFPFKKNNKCLVMYFLKISFWGFR
jgi:GTPase SAR1 family protein